VLAHGLAFHGALKNRADLLVFQPWKNDDLASGKKRGVDFERRIFRRRSDQHDVARLDVGEKGVLLRTVEAVNLINEDDGSRPAKLPRPPRLFHDSFDLLDPGGHGRKWDEVRLGRFRNDARQGGLSGSRRSPEDDRGDAIRLNGVAKELSGAEKLFQSDELFERLRPHQFR
jgi:hypothetical protein